MSDLTGYFAEVGKHKLLTKEQEVTLSQRIEAGDRLARDQMISANLRLAISIAKKYQYTGCSLEDLIQESSLGLIKAVDRFDWRKGFKFSTYACWWIKQSVRKHVASNTSAIRLPTHARGLLWKMRTYAEEYEEEFGVAPTNEELADLLGVKPKTLAAIIKSARYTVSLDAKVGKDGEGRSVAETIPDKSEGIDTLLDRQKLVVLVREALGSLTPREDRVIRLRFGLSEEETNHEQFPITQKEIKNLEDRNS